MTTTANTAGGSDAAPSLPLTGVRVVTVEQAVAAPFCSRQLADMGADVIKIERPDGGDFARDYDGALNGLSAYFAWLNRAKRSVILNLKQPADRAILAKLLQCADVFIHNLAPGAVERMGFDFEHLQQTCPRLVWCAISGYGPDGPYRKKKAYDLLVQAEAGIVSQTGTPAARAKVGVSIADIAAGLYGYSSILAALVNRERTGRGDRIDISMLECLTEWMMPQLYTWLGTGRSLQPLGLRHSMIVPYGVYPCLDGTVNFAIQSEREWRRFCADVLHDDSLINDDRFRTNAARVRHRAELDAIIEDHFRKWSREEMLASMTEAGIASGRVNDVPAVVNHEQLAARHRWTSVPSPTGAIAALLPPHNLRHAPSRMGAVPALGEHTLEVLAELNLAGTQLWDGQT